MIGLPRFAHKMLKIAAFAGLLAAPVGPGVWSWAQAVPAPAAAAATATPELTNAVDNFWHFGKVGSYELAAAYGQKIIAAAADPEAVLVAFEAAASQRGENIDVWLARWQGIDEMRETTAQVSKVIAEGYRARRSSAKFIYEQINRLSGGESSRGWAPAISRLRESGELAVPLIVDLLRDPTKRSMQLNLRAALRDLGRYSLNPLVAATQMQDWDTLVVVISALGDLGYDAAAPYIARVLESNEAPASVKSAATEAMRKLKFEGGRPSATGASNLFFDLGQRIYDGHSAITSDLRYPSANIWSWDAQSGLTRKEVPHEIFNDVMAMRASEYTLTLGGPRSDDALALWLAANYRRESDLPKGAVDATRAEGNPSGHYWGVAAGARFLNAALARAIRDRNSDVAFSATRSLQQIVGQSSLFTDQSSRPLIDAMQFPDRRVRFEAAFALAGALPQTRFEGQQRVIPLLAEAISQSGQIGVLVVTPAQSGMNTLMDDLKKDGGYSVVGATSAAAAANAAGALPAVDVILVSDEAGVGVVDELFSLAAQNSHLSGAARLVITRNSASPYESRKATDVLLSTTSATDTAGLKSAIDDACAKAGVTPMTKEAATDYATRAGELMLQVGTSRGQVYDLAPAKQTLLAALGDARPEIVKLAGQVLAMLNDKEAQNALLRAASEEKTADDVKISLYNSLTTSARFWGNGLEGAQIQMLQKTVADAANQELRSAAAEARGALNLPADQAKSLIVNQAKL